MSQISNAYVSHVTILTPTGGPNWAEIVTAVATGVIALGLFVGLFQLREARRTRHTEAAARMSSRWESRELVEARNKIDKYESDVALRDGLLSAMRSRSEERELLLRELSFFEELGAMEKLGAISLRWVDETMRDLVVARWSLWERTIDALRGENPQEKGVYANFETLVAHLRGQHLTLRQRASRWLAAQLSY